jgi:DNA-binding NarL/FixJ family response regulator
MAIRLVVADPSPIFRSAVKSVLEEEGGFEVEYAASLDELLAVSAEREPAVALVDLDLPAEGGIAAAAALAQRHATRAIVWSYRPQARVVLDAMRSNASGYLSKEVRSAALVDAVRAASRGETPLPRSLARELVRGLHVRALREEARDRTAVLSTRELDVLGLIARGHTNPQIAGELYLSEFTVKRHVHNILLKLGERSRLDAARLYVQAHGGPGRAPAPEADEMAELSPIPPGVVFVDDTDASSDRRARPRRKRPRRRAQ